MVKLRGIAEEDMRHRGAVVEDGGALYDRLGLSLSAIVLQRRKWPILSGNGHHTARLGARVRPAREIRPPFIEGNRIRHRSSLNFRLVAAALLLCCSLLRSSAEIRARSAGGPSCGQYRAPKTRCHLRTDQPAAPLQRRGLARRR